MGKIATFTHGIRNAPLLMVGRSSDSSPLIPGVTVASGWIVGDLDKARMRLVCKAVSVKLWKSGA